MTATADTLPDDPGTLKAMLLAERARAERLEQIIKELQRHRFGRRAETLPEDQLLLGLEEVEQTRRALRPRTKRRRQASGQATPPSAASTVDRCQRICRASRWWSTSTIMPARAARARCIGLARI